MISNYKLLIAYDGTRYHGWEHQPDKDTIQGKLETVLLRMTNSEKIDVIGAGRTDAGVHARAMVANVHLDTELTPDEIKSYMNRYLPEDIAIREVRLAGSRFHARYNALGKTYRYTCYCGDAKPVFDRKYTTVLNYDLNIDKMREAASFLIGKHDFRSFCGNARMKKSTVRHLDTLEIAEKKGYLTFTLHGDGFLQNMVRIIVGTLLEVGKGTWAPEHVSEILEEKDRRLAGPTAPPEGLMLLKVDYE